MRLRLVVLAALLATSGCVRSAPLSPTNGPWRFSGGLFELNDRGPGGPIAGARLTVVDGVNLDASVTTDGGGHFTFDGLAQGRFTIMIAAPGYTTVNPVVELYKDTEANFGMRHQ